MSRRDPPLIALLTTVAVGAYVLGVLSYYAFSRCFSKAPTTQQMHADHAGKASSFGIDGSFTPIRARSPSRFSLTTQDHPSAERPTSIGSLYSEIRGDRVAIHGDIEPGSYPQDWRDTSKPLSLPYYGSLHPNYAPNGALRAPGSAATSSQPLVNATGIRPTIPRRRTMEDLKPIPLVQISPVMSEPVNHARSCSVPAPLSPVRPPPSGVAWHLPSRSRSITKRQEGFKHEQSASEYPPYGIPTPPPTATAEREGRRRPTVLDSNIFEASLAVTPSSNGCTDPLLSVQSVQDSVRLTPSPTLESVVQLYESFPEPPEPNPKENTSGARPRTTSNASTIQVSAPTAAHPNPIPVPLKHPGRPHTIRPRRAGSFSIPHPQPHRLPSRPHTASAAGSVPIPRPSLASNQVALASPKRVYKSPSANVSLVSLAEDSFIVPPHSPPTPRLATPSSMSSLRPKTPPRSVSSRNAIYFGSGSTNPQPEDRCNNRRQI